MRIIDMRPEITPFDDMGETHGHKRKVGNWSFEDITCFVPARNRSIRFRHVFHYTTLMGYYSQEPKIEFDHVRDEKYYIWPDEWEFTPVSIGHGGVSDQRGMNQLMSIASIWRYCKGHEMYKTYGFRYHRDQRGGGPRIVRETPTDDQHPNAAYWGPEVVVD